MPTTTLPLLAALLLAVPAFATPADHNGWGWLVERLVADGIDRTAVEQAFDDPRMPAFDGLDFGLSPREPQSLYRHFLKPASLAAARSCHARLADELRAAAAAHGVPASLVAAIIHVESGCGRNTGRTRILHALARLAMADEPANLERNVARHAPDGDPETAARARARGAWLGATFYREVHATFGLAHRLQRDPLELRGSSAGAIGAPQFLPSNYFEHGKDGDADGWVDLHNPADAAASCAAYLAANGWKDGLGTAARRRVIWTYNHSDAYIDAVLAVANAIERPAPPVQMARTAKRKSVAKSKAPARAVTAKRDRRPATKPQVQAKAARATAGPAL